MPFASLVTPLRLLALALPFLFCFIQGPNADFWPLFASWNCAALLLLLALAQGAKPAPGAAPWQIVGAGQLAAGLLCAALVAAVIGLLQYFLGDPGIPGVWPSTPGQATGNLRQRNQQASLISLGALALLWLQTYRTPALIAAVPQPSRPGAQRRATCCASAALALLTAASAATASRTGALQWLLLLGLWPVVAGRAYCRAALAAAAGYGLAAWALPLLLQAWSGVAAEGLFRRLLGDQSDCNSRSVLWSNVLQLIAQKPWTGWGWGELDYAHYITPFEQTRFCALLGNAHNLPLQLAVELGLPLALLVCAALLVWLVRSRPWRERDPARQLAWGVLLIVGLHSMLEFPLWYGPFQLVTLLALLLLCSWRMPLWAASARAGLALATTAALALGAYLGRDYYRVSQLYLPLAERTPALRSDTVRKVGNTPFFRDQVDFALLTTMRVTEQNAGQAHAVANKLLHFSPEPRVIAPLIDSATLLGLDAEAALHRQRYRAAYPADYARWVAARSN